MEVVFWKVRRQDNPHVACDGAKTSRICRLSRQLGVTVTAVAAQDAESPVCDVTVHSRGDITFFFRASFLMTIVLGIMSVWPEGFEGSCRSHYQS